MHSATESLFATMRGRTDRLLLVVLWVGLLVALGIGEAQAATGLALMVGLPIAGCMTLLVLTRPGALLTRLAMGVALMAMVALHIHLSRGLIETHFGVFVVLALLVAYRDWRVIAMAAAAIAIQHLSFNYLQQIGWNLYCLRTPSFTVILFHAAYVIAQAAFEIYLVKQMHEEVLEGFELDRMVQDITAQEGLLNLHLSDTAAVSTMGLRLQDVLRDIAIVVGSVRTASDQIAVSSMQIARGSDDLSRRTEEQASSLEETSSSMEEMTGTVQRNAAATREVEALANSAQVVAQRGGIAVGQVVATMDEIAAAAGRIADITGVIDGIAFQTNILALNAAVEAARAGEQGKGFAVVAAEVRSLAHRSAAASREVRDLINASNSRVTTGTIQGREAAATVEEIISSVEQVSALVKNIHLSTVEQSSGILQVGRAVSQLDQMTQENSALAEESAAAGEALQSLAASLSTAVSRFKLEAGEESIGASATRQTTPRDMQRRVTGRRSMVKALRAA